MRVLWITNGLLPEAAGELGVSVPVSGGWLIDPARRLSESGRVELAVACVYPGKELRDFTRDGIRFFLLPGGSRRMLLYSRKNEDGWREVFRRFSPEVVHLHGTEYSHGLAFLRACPEVPAAVTLQGLLRKIVPNYAGGLSRRELLWWRTPSEWLHLSGMAEQALLMRRNRRYEEEILRRVKFVNAINAWDGAVAQSINPSLSVFRYDHNLRPGFYEAPKWNPEEMVPHSILTGQCDVPYKGVHVLVRALSLVRRELPDAVLRLPTEEAPKNGYGRYLRSLIKRLGMEDGIRYIGRQDEAGMIKELRGCNALVVPSAAENTSLLLREAAYLGTPCVASYRGGMGDFLRDKQTGFLYDYPDHELLAQRLIQLFSQPLLAQLFSLQGAVAAKRLHNPERNADAMLNMYEYMLRNPRGGV